MHELSDYVVVWMSMFLVVASVSSYDFNVGMPGIYDLLLRAEHVHGECPLHLRPDIG